MKNNRELYIYERGNCTGCETHKPVNYMGICEVCDKVENHVDRPKEHSIDVNGNCNMGCC